MWEEELTIDGLCNLIVTPLNSPILLGTTTPGLFTSTNCAAPPDPLSIVKVASKGGPTVTPVTASTKYSISGSLFTYPSSFTT